MMCKVEARERELALVIEREGSVLASALMKGRSLENASIYK